MRERGLTLAICTYNGANRLEKTLEAILKNEAIDIPWELLVVNNASTDSTANFVKEFWPKGTHQLRIIHEKTPGAIHARKKALREARYAYLSYIDDDNWISRNWVEEVYRIFEAHPTVGMISCPSTANLSAPPPDFFEGFKGWLAVGTRFSTEGIVEDRPVSFWTAGLSLRLKAFDDLKNTDYSTCLTGRTGKQTYGGEDHELCLSLTLLGWDAYYTHQISFVHDIPLSRLEVPYVERLIQNGGKSKAILGIYRNEYWRMPLYNPYWAVLSYSWHFFNRALRYWLKRSLGRANTPMHPNRISYLHAMGRLQSYFLHFRRFAQAQRNIRILRSLKSKIGRSH